MLAIVECSAYGTTPFFKITQNPQQIFAFHTSTYANKSDGAHVDLVHLTLNSNSNSVYLQQKDVMIDMGCIITSDCSVVVNATIRFNFCTKPEDQARPYFITIPQEWTLHIPLSHPTDQYPLFSAFAKVRWIATACYVYIYIYACMCYTIIWADGDLYTLPSVGDLWQIPICLQSVQSRLDC